MTRKWRLDLAEEALLEGDDDSAKRMVDAHLAEHPDDEDALRLKAALREPDRSDASEPETTPTRAAPPVGVVMMAFWFAGVGVLQFLFAVFSAGAGSFLLVPAPLAVGLVHLLLAWGLVMLREWAWLLAMLLVGISLARGTLPSAPLGPLLDAANLVALAYLAVVRRRFSPAPQAGAAPT